MTKNGEENEQEWKQEAAAAEAGQKEGHEELKEESTGDEQLSNSRMAHLLAVYQSKVRGHLLSQTHTHARAHAHSRRPSCKRKTNE